MYFTPVKAITCGLEKCVTLLDTLGFREIKSVPGGWNRFKIENNVEKGNLLADGLV